MEARLTVDKKGHLVLWIGEVPGLELDPEEAIVNCLKREIEDFRREANEPHSGADPYARKYADILEAFLQRLRPH